MIRSRFFVLLFACAFGSLVRVAVAQTLSLAPTSVFVLPSEWRHPLYLPVRCDGDGNYYFREYESGANASPVLKASPRVDHVTRFSVDSDSGLKGGAVQDFAIGVDGTVYELVQLGNDVEIVEFSEDGHPNSKIGLEKQFWATHFAVFDRGDEFLVAGSALPIKGGPPPKLVTAIFDRAGRVIRTLVLPHDPAEIKAPKANEKRPANYLSDQGILPLVLGDTQTDGRGNLFILRASTPPIVYMADSAGHLVRTITAIPPEPGMQVGVMHVWNGQLALLFQKSDAEGQIEKRTMLVLDTTTGHKLEEYFVPESLGAAFACYTGEDFGFVTTKEGKLAIQTAKPE